MDPEMLLELLSDPANADLLAQLGAYDDKSQNLDRRSAMAQQMMAQPSAEGRQVGHAYVASSPLEHMGTLAMRGVGAAKQHGVNWQRDAMAQGGVDARKALGSVMSQAMKARKAQSPIDPNAPASYAAPLGIGEGGTDGWGY